MDYDVFGRVMELVHLDPYWGSIKTSSHTNSIYYAVKNNKCLLHYEEDKLVGFCTYGFFNQREIDSDQWDGDDVYSREEGEVLYFPKFQCRAGPKQVLRFVREINDYLGRTYPELKLVGYADRGYGERHKNVAVFMGRNL